MSDKLPAEALTMPFPLPGESDASFVVRCALFFRAYLEYTKIAQPTWKIAALDQIYEVLKEATDPILATADTPELQKTLRSIVSFAQEVLNRKKGE